MQGQSPQGLFRQPVLGDRLVTRWRCGSKRRVGFSGGKLWDRPHASVRMGLQQVVRVFCHGTVRQVNVPLHGEKILAHHVASEAQITDLQLTFLLALAQSYEWTPWRALLLDDPTQHHDLVHASAVFDLLRDYVAEKNFQVLLATHDSIQAKFFMRKLQNDGIPARICTLQATSAGVVPIYKER